MISKTGNIYINNKLQKNRYDKNEDYGVIGQEVQYYEIIYTFKIFGFKLSISRFRVLRVCIDCQSVAFDPPRNADKELE
jgi:hypothetical protein